MMAALQSFLLILVSFYIIDYARAFGDGDCKGICV
jgi:hypothetical protein